MGVETRKAFNQWHFFKKISDWRAMKDSLRADLEAGKSVALSTRPNQQGRCINVFQMNNFLNHQ